MRYLVFSVFSALVISGCGREAPRKHTSQPRLQEAESQTARVAKTDDVSNSSEKIAEFTTPAADQVFEGAMESEFHVVEQPQPIPPQQQQPRPPRLQRPQPQPNLLTAGSLNDSANLQAYREYLAETRQNGAGRLLPEFSLGPVATINVVDAENHAVSNAVVTLHHPETNEVLMTTRTRADGTTLLVDRNSVFSQFEEPLPIEIRSGPEINRQAITLQDRTWLFRLPSKRARLPHRLDVAFVIDTTGTMDDELEYLKSEIDHVSSTLQTQFPDVGQRFALVCYRDHYDQYVTRTFDFTDSISEFRGHLSAQRARGGGDYPEAVHLGLEKATQLSWRTDNSARLVFLIGDAPPHRNQVDSAFQAIEELRNLGVAVYPLAGSGTKDECEFVFRAMACLTRGEYLFLTDHSGVGQAHETPATSRFEVEPLNQLLVRVMAEQLSGRSMLAQDVIAVEDGLSDRPVRIVNAPPPYEETAPPYVHEHHSGHHHSGHHPTHPVQHRYFMVNPTTVVRLVAGAIMIGLILWIDRRMRLS
ncbi:vWA domain-containing protein [Thalassoroseus pseudoceratinae]|uniref:vWA domain-containing protein n=1 Tax=Thalassoroseus pseudoceratinae TaxID=2713176 RepID=UPI00142071DC|nr:vWA domain-containing protein [Thalassoroseus pseudoceratinae]